MASSTAASQTQTFERLERDLQEKVGELQKVQDDLQERIDVRQRLESQLTENKQVQAEFARVKPDKDTIYKQIRPTLLRQSYKEARENVDKRITFIEQEITRTETQLTTLTQRTADLRQAVGAIQQAAITQRQQGSAAVEGSAAA